MHIAADIITAKLPSQQSASTVRVGGGGKVTVSKIGLGHRSARLGESVARMEPLAA